MLRPRPSLVPVAALVVALALLSISCAGHAKPVLVKFDASVLTAVQTIASVERELSSVGVLTPAQSLGIRLKLRPVITLGEQATTALLAWQPGQQTPASLLHLSTSIGDLLTTVIGMLPDGTAKARILTAIAAAQQAWSAVIVLMGDV